MLNYNKKSPELVERFLKRLHGTNGNIQLAAQSLGISGGAIRSWRKRDKEFKKQVDLVLMTLRQNEQ